MMNKYLKSHITAAAFCAGVLLAVSCSTSREPRTMRLFMQSGRPNIFLPHEESAPSGVLAEQVGFTTSSDTLPGEFEEVSDSTDDVWKTIHLGGVDIVAARTVVKQVTMREGSVRLEFNIHVPSLLIDSCWRVTLTPMLCTSDSSGFPLPPVVLSGSSFTRMQEADYKAYRLFLNGIVDPSAYDSVYLDRKGINKDIACRQRFFYELYGKERDRQLAYEKWKRLALERQNFWNTRTHAVRPQFIEVSKESEDLEGTPKEPFYYGSVVELLFTGTFDKVFIRLDNTNQMVTAYQYYDDKKRWKADDRVGIRWNAEEAVKVIK